MPVQLLSRSRKYTGNLLFIFSTISPFGTLDGVQGRGIYEANMSGITEIFVRSFGYLSIYPRGQIISSAFQARKKVISASYFFSIGTGKLTADQNSKEGIVWMWGKNQIQCERGRFRGEG